MNKQTLTYVGAFVAFAMLVFFPNQNNSKVVQASIFSFNFEKEVELGDFPVVIPTYRFGFVMENYHVEEGKVAQDMTLGKLLSDADVDYPTIQKLVDNCTDVFNVNSGFRVDKTYMILSDIESNKPEHLVFEPNVFEYIVFDLNGEYEVTKVEKPIKIQTKTVEGEIESSLWETLTTQGISFEVASKMEDALQWSVDFSHTQKGDRFKMYYDQQYIDGKEVGAGQVYVAYYNREGKESYAVWFDNGEYKGFYDLEGRAIKSNFLKSPVKFSRISSRFNRRRFHPILKRVRPHLGTDYAAPYGTPIYAVGTGVIIEAAYTKGNGRYIKIKHDDVYKTQYLHMSKFAKGMKRGVQVAQGEIIGYVGSSGLATGPHVCFRFWKNGRQVNHLRENLPAPKPLPIEVLDEFFVVKDELIAKFNEEHENDEAVSEDENQTL